MKVVVGLGNPGSEYEGTRHNVGFDALEELARRWQVGSARRKFQAEIAEANFRGEKVLLVAPQTFMNLSGQAVSQVVKFFQVEPADLLVVCDDMNLPLARLRFRSSGSAGGQRGLKHIIESLATDAIPRLRFGIGRPPAQMNAVDYVLTRFRKAERPQVEAALIRAADGVETWIQLGISAAMNQFNAGEADNPDDSRKA